MLFFKISTWRIFFSAEARFIRACQYFYLSQYCGDVPLVIKTLTPDEADLVSKNKKQDLVECELQDAVNDFLNGDFYGSPYPVAKNIRVKSGGIRDSFSRRYVTKKSFRAGQDSHWPIPQNKIDINPNLK